MGQSAEQLRREIEDTRGDLGETLDAIGDRLSPGRMMERRKNRMRSGLQTVRERVMGTVSDTGSAGAVADTAGGVADAAGGAVSTLKETPDTVRQQTQGNPLAAGAIAIGVGVLLASVFPATEKERRAADQLMDKAEPLKDELRRPVERWPSTSRSRPARRSSRSKTRRRRAHRRLPTPPRRRSAQLRRPPARAHNSYATRRRARSNDGGQQRRTGRRGNHESIRAAHTRRARCACRPDRSRAFAGRQTGWRASERVVVGMVTDPEPYPEELGGLDEATETLDTDERLDRSRQRPGVDEPGTGRTERGGSQPGGSDKQGAEPT